VLVLLPVALTGRASAAPQGQPALSAEDKKYLDGLLKEFLFDPPKRAVRVTVQVEVHDVSGFKYSEQAKGWLEPGQDGKPGRVHSTDGSSVPAPPEKEMKKVDSPAACKARYAAPPKADALKQEAMAAWGRRTDGKLVDDDLARAAWLYRLGHEELAARALAL